MLLLYLQFFLLVRHSNGPIEIILFGPWYYITNQSIDECIIFSRSKLNELKYWPQLARFTYLKSTRFKFDSLKMQKSDQKCPTSEKWFNLLIGKFLEWHAIYKSRNTLAFTSISKNKSKLKKWIGQIMKISIGNRCCNKQSRQWHTTTT